MSKRRTADEVTRLLKDVDRDQALEIDLHHLGSADSARRANPSTQVYELIAILIGARTGEKCPITGTWKLVGDASVTIQLNKGENTPDHSNNSV